MSKDNEIKEFDAIQQSPEGPKAEKDDAGDEFKITVRKLEMPVQPRGVLAE